MVTGSQDEIIARDRVRYHSVPLRNRKMPKWFSRRVRAVSDYTYPGEDEMLLGHSAIGRFSGVFDHWGTGHDGSFVSEPYADIDDLEFCSKVQCIANMLGIRCSITNSLTSWWFPGRTIRVSFFETPKSKPVKLLRSEAKAARKALGISE